MQVWFIFRRSVIELLYRINAHKQCVCVHRSVLEHLQYDTEEYSSVGEI